MDKKFSKWRISMYTQKLLLYTLVHTKSTFGDFVLNLENEHSPNREFILHLENPYLYPQTAALYSGI